MSATVLCPNRYIDAVPITGSFPGCGWVGNEKYNSLGVVEEVEGPAVLIRMVSTTKNASEKLSTQQPFDRPRAMGYLTGLDSIAFAEGYHICT